MRKTPSPQIYTCLNCKRAFSRKDSLERHRRKHPMQCGGAPKEGPEVCLICKKAISKRFTMERHMRSHKTKEDLACAKCGKTFAESSSLSRHLRTHKDPPAEENLTLKLTATEMPPAVPSFPCIMCGVTCKSQVMIETHLAVTHATSGRLRLRVV